MKDLRTVWPFDKLRHPCAEWAEIAEEHYWHALEVLPPLYFRGGFAIGEAANHTADDVPVHCCIVTVRGRYFARELPMDIAAREAEALRASLPGDSEPVGV